MIAVADTSPINYLVLIDKAELLARLYTSVILPGAVLKELRSPRTPALVRRWISRRASWLQVRLLQNELDPTLAYLGAGERETIALAHELNANEVLLDEAAARREAQRRNLRFIGTLGLLRRASQLGWIDLAACLRSLGQTTFRARPDLIASLLAEDAALK